MNSTCIGCDTPIPNGSDKCPMCGAPVSTTRKAVANMSPQPLPIIQHVTEIHRHRIVTDEQPGLKKRETLGVKQMLGLVGSIILFVGVFTPIVSLPIIGNMNYFQNGKGDGTIVLIFAVVSLVFVLARKYNGLWFTGLGSMAVMAFTFMNFQKKMSETRAQMETELAGNPFRGLADIAMQSVQLQWGWAILIVGAALVIASAATKEDSYR